MKFEASRFGAKIKRWSIMALLWWTGASLLAGISPLLLAIPMAPQWPSWSELPWTGLADFAVTPDGRLYTYISFYDYVMVYDEAGDFQRSWPSPLRLSGGGHCLASGQDGRVFLKISRTVFVLSPEGKELSRVPREQVDSRVWRLTESGEVEVVLDPDRNIRAPQRPVRHGEILFGEECGFSSAKEFARPDGGTVRRLLGPRLQIQFADGHSRTLMPPWYLLLIQLPFSAAPVIILSIWLKDQPE